MSNELEFCREQWGKLLDGGTAGESPSLKRISPLKSQTCLTQSVPLTDPNYGDKPLVSVKVKIVKPPADYTLPSPREFLDLYPTLTIGQLKHLLFPLPFEFLSILSKGKVLADDRTVEGLNGMELHCMVKPNAVLLTEGFPRTLPSLDGETNPVVPTVATGNLAASAMAMGEVKPEAPVSSGASSERTMPFNKKPALSAEFWSQVTDLLGQQESMGGEQVEFTIKAFQQAYKQLNF